MPVFYGERRAWRPVLRIHFCNVGVYALSRLPIPAQAQLLHRIERYNLSAVYVERIADREIKRLKTLDGRGPQYSRRTFKTAIASVVFTFRCDAVCAETIRQALDEIRQQLAGDETRTR